MAIGSRSWPGTGSSTSSTWPRGARCDPRLTRS